MASRIAADPVRDTAWQRFGACVGANPELWFHETNALSVEAAKAICNRCPVTAECLAYAMGDRRIVGIWGGLTEHERRSLRERRRRKAVSA